jgi:hypothetical protein
MEGAFWCQLGRKAGKVKWNSTKQRSGMIAKIIVRPWMAVLVLVAAMPQQCGDVRWSSDHGRSHDN